MTFGDVAPDASPFEEMPEMGVNVVFVSLRALQPVVAPFLDVALGQGIEVALTQGVPNDACLAGGVVASHGAFAVKVFGDVALAALGHSDLLEVLLALDGFLEKPVWGRGAGGRASAAPASAVTRCTRPISPRFSWLLISRASFSASSRVLRSLTCRVIPGGAQVTLHGRPGLAGE